jgi:hypothetical protein
MIDIGTRILALTTPITKIKATISAVFSFSRHLL